MQKVAELTPEQQKIALNLAHAVTAAKLSVYELNVQLESMRTKVTTAVRNVELAEAQFVAGVGTLAQAHGITNWRISPDFTRIEENQ